MKPVLKNKKQVHYVSEATMIEFINVNSDMEWNECCTFIRKHKISDDDGERSYYSKNKLEKHPNDYYEEQVKWVLGFFNSHPWIEEMYIVFDD